MKHIIQSAYVHMWVLCIVYMLGTKYTKSQNVYIDMS